MLNEMKKVLRKCDQISGEVKILKTMVNKK